MNLDVLLGEGPKLAAEEDQWFTPSDDRVRHAGDEDGVVTGIDLLEDNALGKPNSPGQVGMAETRTTHGHPDEVIIIRPGESARQPGLMLGQECDGKAAAAGDRPPGATTVDRADGDDRWVERDAGQGVRRHSLIGALEVRSDDCHPGWKVRHEIAQRAAVGGRQLGAVDALSA
jgi:hypothetical protein